MMVEPCNSQLHVDSVSGSSADILVALSSFDSNERLDSGHGGGRDDGKRVYGDG
jgi:hypothetical protein